MPNILVESFKAIAHAPLEPTDFDSRVVISKPFVYPGIDKPTYLLLQYQENKDFQFDEGRKLDTRLNIVISTAHRANVVSPHASAEINFCFRMPEENTIVVSPFVNVFGSNQGLGLGKNLMQLTDIVMDHALRNVTALKGKKVVARIVDNAHEYTRKMEELDCHGKLPKRRGWTSHVVKHAMSGFTQIKDLSLRDPVFEKVYQE